MKLFSLILLPLALFSDPIHLDAITIYGHETSLLGEAISASEGSVTQGEIAQRPMLRSGEILEFVPGMIVTQHSGAGKANQYFLRGFNLDHGTDFRTSVDNMPVNMRTHGHGQGYTDLNFIIPELIDSISYQKGPYHSENGDFSTAGAAEFHLTDKLNKGFLSIEIGEHGYLRTVLADSIIWDDSTLTLGLEAHYNDGPWVDIEENLQKRNALVRYSKRVGGGELDLTLMAYSNKWNAADQIPERAVEAGIISPYGSIDTTVGGDSSRYSLSGSWSSDHLSVSAYAIRSELDLFSNFTYLLDDPIDGDQFEQVDERSIYGTDLCYEAHQSLGDVFLYHKSGIQIQYDAIDEVGLHHTRARERLDTVRNDRVDEYSVGIFYDLSVDLSEETIFYVGARYDYLNVDVSSDISQNSGTADDGLLSFKGGISHMLSPSWELYLSAGQSFHSNDARGATMHIDPVSGATVKPVDLLVQALGGEVGLRYFDPGKLNLSLALWQLDLDSELLYVGDAGTTEPNRSSSRWGVELTAYYWWDELISSDLEFSWNHARFDESDGDEGNYIEGSLPYVISAGITLTPVKQLEATLRWRHFGERTLDSHDDVHSDPFNVVNLGVHYRHSNWRYRLNVLNLLDSDDHDIDYLYTSRLKDEASSGIEDIHFHPIEPRSLRFEIAYLF